MKKANWLTVMIAALALAGAACSNNDGGGGPATPDDLTEPDAIDITGGLIDSMEQFIESALYWAQSGPGGRDLNEPEWDGSAWTWSDTGSYSEEDFSMDWTFAFWLQYLNAAGNPVQDHEQAYSMHLIYDGEMETTSADGSTDFDFDYDFTYTGLPTETINMSGLGEWNWDHVSGSGNHHYEMSWYTTPGGVDIPTNGVDCPSGGIVWDLPPYELHMDLNDPAGYLSYELLDSAGAVVHSGTEDMQCNP